MTELLQWMAISFSDGVSKEGGVVACLSVLESVLVLSSGLVIIRLSLFG